jgi:hypothetical protein
MRKIWCTVSDEDFLERRSWFVLLFCKLLLVKLLGLEPFSACSSIFWCRLVLQMNVSPVHSSLRPSHDVPRLRMLLCQRKRAVHRVVNDHRHTLILQVIGNVNDRPTDRPFLLSLPLPFRCLCITNSSLRLGNVRGRGVLTDTSHERRERG